MTVLFQYRPSLHEVCKGTSYRSDYAYVYLGEELVTPILLLHARLQRQMEYLGSPLNDHIQLFTLFSHIASGGGH